MLIIAILVKLRQLSIKFLSEYCHTLSTFFIILLICFSEMFEMELISGVTINLVSLLEY